jgi:hypothetical protein
MKLPLGVQDFEKIRTQGMAYVDKTRQIHGLIQSGQYYFLARPRRFGKSLLLSTLRALYEGRKSLFEGLWIADHWDWEEHRQVIHLKFSSQGVRTLGAEKAIFNMLNSEADRLGVQLTAESYDGQFKELIEKVGKEKKTVILIDEYDKPIIDYLDDMPRAVENRQILKNFYSVIKDSDPYLEFLFITGVSRFSKTSIFSELNNLTNLTMHPLSAQLLGITASELDSYFGELVSTIAASRNEEEEELKKEIQRWYNGYSWNGKDKVYNPFSLLSFLLSRDFKNYWFETGTPTFLVKKMRDTRFFRIEPMKAADSALDSYELENLNTLTLLFQTGYVTIVEKYRGNIYLIDYPNQEVKASLEERLLNAFSHDEFGRGKVRALELAEALEAGDMEQFVSIINATFATLPYNLWQKENEAFYHALIHLLCSLVGVFLASEINSSQGRLDAKVETPEAIYIFEFKLNQSAQAAVDQIAEKGYFKPYAQSPKKRIGVGINFSTEKKEVEEWVERAF